MPDDPRRPPQADVVDFAIPLRLAIRCEGDVLNAYVAPAEGMAGAYIVSSISHVEADNELLQEWRAAVVRWFNRALKALCPGVAFEPIEVPVPPRTDS